MIETNHVLHLLVSIFMCGLWLPIWLLTTISDDAHKRSFRCTKCGQSEDQGTPEERAAAARARQRVAREKAEDRDEVWHLGGEQVRVVVAVCIDGLCLVATEAIAELKRLPERTDRVLRGIAGEGNDIILWFMRTLIIILLVGAFVGIGVVTYELVTAEHEPSVAAANRRTRRRWTERPSTSTLREPSNQIYTVDSLFCVWDDDAESVYVDICYHALDRLEDAQQADAATILANGT